MPCRSEHIVRRGTVHLNLVNHFSIEYRSQAIKKPRGLAKPLYELVTGGMNPARTTPSGAIKGE